MTIDLAKLAEPFPGEDIEWRVSRAGMGKHGPWCRCLAYVDARAIQTRLDDVCGVDGWQLTKPIQFVHDKRCAIGVGIMIRVNDGEWITKWDVSELTDSSDNIPPFKGGFSGAIKRAGAQLGIGRYLYHLDEMYAEISDTDPGVKGWYWARLSQKHGGVEYYWKPPQLPSWALPKEPEHEISEADLKNLKRMWRDKFAPDEMNPENLREGFSTFVTGIVGTFPLADYTCWTKQAYDQCTERINSTTDADGPSSDVPFEE